MYKLGQLRVGSQSLVVMKEPSVDNSTRKASLGYSKTGRRSRPTSHLLGFVRIDGVEVFIDEVLPELNLGAGEVIHLSPAEVPVLDPEGVDQVVSLLLNRRGH